MLLEKRSKSTKAINEINVVPYVDIMLVLLVIFMVVAPLAVQGLDINPVSYTHLTLPTK